MEMDLEQKSDRIAIVSNEDIIREFETMGINVNLELIEEFKRLCILYDMDAEEVFAQWIAFINNAHLAEKPNLESFERFEREFINRKAVDVQTEILDAPKKKQKTHIKCSSDFSILRDYGNETETTRTIHLTKETFDKNVDTPNIDSECELELKKHILQYYGNSLSFTKWLNTNGNTCELLPFDSSLHLSERYKFMKFNLHHCSEIMDQNMQRFAEFLQNRLEIETLGDLDIESVGIERYFIGRIRVEITEGKQNERCVILEGTQNSRRRANIDLSDLSEYSLFPGQIIALKSTYDFNNGLKPSEIADFSLTIKPLSTKPIELKNPLFVVFAAGPYCSANEVNDILLRKVLKYVKKAKPQFIILSGPFVDSENNITKENVNPFDLFNDVMNTINHQLQNTGTTAIVIPSTRDLNHDFIYPTPPFQRTFNQWPNIYFSPNPCLLSISGIVIAVNAVDVLMHMIRNEVAKYSGDNEANSRMIRLCKHFLSQQSFYPLSPADPQINLEYSKMKYLNLPVTPHLFLLSSQLKSFAKKSQGCVFVNNESVSKGIMSRIRIEPPIDNREAVDKYIDIELVKL